MEFNYLLDYFLFTFVASLGAIQIALSKKYSTRTLFGAFLVISAYWWFFSSRNRNVHTIVEGAQLFLVFSLSAVLAIVATKIFTSAGERK